MPLPKPATLTLELPTHGAMFRGAMALPHVARAPRLKHFGSNQLGCGRCCALGDCKVPSARRALALSGHSSEAKGSCEAKEAALKAPSNLCWEAGEVARKQENQIELRFNYIFN